ncbi:MAG: DUF4956 domain-containing protein [Clostridia bacterium]|nr:DUF4956 domain-containing protein [Clostridia bacterium]
MFDFINSVTNGNLELKNYLICLAAALACGIITAIAATIRDRISPSFRASLILLPAIVETVILMVSGNVGTGIAVAGAFSLIRFRSVPGKASDITFIFLSMTAGITCAAGYIGVALIFTVIVSAVAIIIAKVNPARKGEYDLKIVTPETLSYAGAFDEVFAEYTKSNRLVKVKTTNMGSLYKLDYKVTLKDVKRTKEFIDAIRCINGNLEIILTEAAERNEEL